MDDKIEVGFDTQILEIRKWKTEIGTWNFDFSWQHKNGSGGFVCGEQTTIKIIDFLNESD